MTRLFTIFHIVRLSGSILWNTKENFEEMCTVWMSNWNRFQHIWLN